VLTGLVLTGNGFGQAGDDDAADHDGPEARGGEARHDAHGHEEGGEAGCPVGGEHSVDGAVLVEHVFGVHRQYHRHQQRQARATGHDQPEKDVDVLAHRVDGEEGTHGDAVDQADQQRDELAGVGRGLNGTNRHGGLHFGCGAGCLGWWICTYRRTN
jgi:hypothetical protein